jgi:hypothetical protein
MKVYQLHIGANSADGTISPGLEKHIQAVVVKEFESFSLLRGKGVFRGKAEDLVIVKIATDREADVYRLASRIRIELNQEGVGVEHDGHYTRVVSCAGDTH